MVNFGSLAAEIGSGVWGTAANFNGFRVLATVLHGTLVVGVSQTLRRWTAYATYTRQGGHHVGHWPTFLVYKVWQVIAMELELSWVYLISHIRLLYIMDCFNLQRESRFFISQWPHRWERAEFDPTASKSLDRFWWNSNLRTISWRPPTTQNFILIRRRGWSRRIPSSKLGRSYSRHWKENFLSSCFPR